MPAPTAPVMCQSQTHWITLFAGSLLSLASAAAPTTEAPTAVEPNAASVLPLAAGVRPGDRNSDARTIDLLVEMQQPTAGVQFNERTPRNPARDGLGRTLPAPQPAQPPQRPQTDAPPTSPAGLFGSGATPPVQTRTQNVMERSPSSDVMPARASGRPASDMPPEVKRWLQWPREVIEYVRENRGFVIGGTAVLLMMGWAASRMFGRRRG